MVGMISEKQYRISDELADYIENFLQENRVSLDKFSKDVKIPKYMLEKVISKNIKMHCYISVLNKIKEYVGYTD